MEYFSIIKQGDKDYLRYGNLPKVDVFRQIKMKKILGFFVKRKIQQGNMYSLYDVSLPDNVDNNIPHENGYKHYQFDSDCLNNDTFNSLEPRAKEGNLQCSSESARIFPLDLTDLDVDDVQNEKSTVPQISNFFQSSSDSSLSENSPSAKQEQSNSPLEGTKKSTKNTYVITISNSKYFHIGSQKTINIGEKALPVVQVEAHPQSLEGYSLEYEAKLNKLLDCESRLTEEWIEIISHHANDNWKEFLRNLGLEESYLDVLEKRSDYNKSLTLYDGLHEYITLFPNTSLSFIVDTLSNTKQRELIEKLAQEMKN